MADASTLGAFRACAHDEAVAYRAMMESGGSHVVSDVVDQGLRRGTIIPCGETATNFATLDLLDPTGDIVGEYCIPTAPAWQWWKEIAGLRAASSDCAVCEPDAYAATYANRGA